MNQLKEKKTEKKRPKNGTKGKKEKSIGMGGRPNASKRNRRKKERTTATKREMLANQIEDGQVSGQVKAQPNEEKVDGEKEEEEVEDVGQEADTVYEEGK